MGILISEFRIYVSRLLRSVGRIKDREPFLKMLYLEANKQFLKFDNEAWAKDSLDVELIHYFEAFEECEDDPVHLLILYVLISMRLDDIAYYDLNVVSVLAGALEMSKVPSSKFECYLSMFLHEPIHDCLASLTEDEQVFATMEIMDSISYEEVSNNNYKAALVVLNDYRNAPVSPIFAGDYTLENVYKVLSKFVFGPLSGEYFNEKDRQTLKRLMELERIANATEKRELMRRFAMIEEMNVRTPIQMVKIILNTIQNYHCYEQYGIDVPLDGNPIKF